MAAKRHRTPTKPQPKLPARPLAHIDPDAVIAEQNVKPIDNPEEMYADFWPPKETADQFVQAVRKWRREGNKGSSD